MEILTPGGNTMRIIVKVGTSTLAHPTGLLLSVTADHNLLLYDARSLQLRKQVRVHCPC